MTDLAALHQRLPRPPAAGALDGGPLDGERWNLAFFTEVPGRPQSKSNSRRYASNGRSGAAAKERAAAQRHKAYTRMVREQIIPARIPRGWQLGPPTPAPVAQRPVVLAAIVAATTLDAPNTPKSLLDACEGMVFHTDASVRASSQITLRRRSGQRLLLGFAQIDPADDPDEVELAAALGELSSLLAARFQLGGQGS